MDDDLRAELICLRRDFESCRSASCSRSDHITTMMTTYREEVVRLGDAAARIASETRTELRADIQALRSDVETLLDLLSSKGHA